MSNDSVVKTLLVAAGVCVACSVVVSATAIGLKPLQDRNRRLDRKQSILLAAGLLEEGQKADVDALFEQIDARLIDLDTGKFIEDAAPEEFDVERAARDPSQSAAIEPGRDLAGIKRRPNRQVVYLVEGPSGFSRVVLPVYGKGLWSTMYGLIALDRDLETVKSFAFFSHGETPGLGGEVDNPRWKAQWIGKQAFADDGSVTLEVIKGRVDPKSPQAGSQVDGLSGATLTGRGVSNLLHFWLGKEGYGPFLERMRSEKTQMGKTMETACPGSDEEDPAGRSRRA